MPGEAEIELHYTQKFQQGNYATIQEFAGAYSVIYRQYLRWMRRFTTVRGGRVLDIGCFTGDFLGILLDEGGADAFGVELQAEAVGIARTRWPDRVFQRNVDYPIEELPDGSLDTVTLLAVIEHVQEPARLVRRIRELLKPGGWLFLETPNASSGLATLTRKWWPPLAPVEHLHLFSVVAIRRILQDAGFEVIDVRPHIKRLPIAYVYEMLHNFGPEWQRLLGPLYRAMPQRLRCSAAPFYVGEMLVAAKRVEG